MASNNHGALAFILSHSILLTNMLHPNINYWSYGEQKKKKNKKWEEGMFGVNE